MLFGFQLKVDCLGNNFNLSKVRRFFRRLLKEAWHAVVHGVTKESDTALQLNQTCKVKISSPVAFNILIQKYLCHFICLSIFTGNRWLKENYLNFLYNVLLYRIMHLIHMSPFLESQCLFLALSKIHRIVLNGRYESWHFFLLLR